MSVALFLLVNLLAGFALLCAIAGATRRRIVEVISLSMALGMGAVPLLLMLLSMCGLPPRATSLFLIAMVFVIVIGVCVWFGRVVRLEPPARPRSSDFVTALSAIAVACCFVALCRFALPYRIHDIDAFSIWGLKAKVVFDSPLNPRPDYFTDRAMSFSHMDYPLLLPFLEAGFFAQHGRVDDRAVLVLHVAMYVVVAMLSYSVARLGHSRAVSSLIAALVATTPALIRWSGAGDADVMLTMFVFGAVLSMLRGELILMGAFLALGALTKHEGVVIGVVMMACTAISRRTWEGESPGEPLRETRRWLMRLGGSLALPCLLFFPWFIWSRGIPQTHEDYLARLTPTIFSDNLDRVPAILSALTGQLINFEVWGGFWLALIATAVAGASRFRSRTTMLLWSIFVLQLAGYVAVYVVTPWELAELLSMTTHRVFLHFLPVSCAIIALHSAGNAGTMDGSTEKEIA